MRAICLFSILGIVSSGTVACGGVVESSLVDNGEENAMGGESPTLPDAALCVTDICDAQGCSPSNVVGVSPVWELAVWSGAVYFTTLGSAVYGANGTVGSFDRCGSDAWSLASGAKAPYGLAVSDAGICWSNLGMTVNGAYNDDGSVRCMAQDGVHQVYDGELRPYGIVMDATDVYFGAYLPLTIFGARPDGTGLRTVFVEQSAWDSGTQAMGIDDGYVYRSSYQVITRVSKAGGEAVTVCSGNWDVRDILVDDNRVYFNDFTTGTVLSVPKAGGTTSVVAAPGSIGNQMAMDDTHVYYLGGGDVYRVAKSGGATELIASGATQYALAVDDDYVYWDSPMESVKRVRKPGH